MRIIKLQFPKIESFTYDLVLAFLTSSIRKWVYHKAVSYQ